MEDTKSNKNLVGSTTNESPKIKGRYVTTAFLKLSPLAIPNPRLIPKLLEVGYISEQSGYYCRASN